MVFDWPDTARFLTPEERLRVRRRLAQDKQSSTGEEYDKRHIIAALKDWKCWGYAVIYMGTLCPLYSFSLFLPTILAGMGYKGTRAQLLSVPPYAVAAALTIFVGWVADKTRMRGYCNMATVTVGMVGFCMLLGSTDPHIQYAGTFLGAAGIYPAIPNSLTWCSNNIEGVYKRGVIVGIVVGWGNLNGVVSQSLDLLVSLLTTRLGQLKYLPCSGEATILDWTRYRTCIPSCVPARRHDLYASHVAPREQAQTNGSTR